MNGQKCNFNGSSGATANSFRRSKKTRIKGKCTKLPICSQDMADTSDSSESDSESFRQDTDNQEQTKYDRRKRPGPQYNELLNQLSAIKLHNNPQLSPEKSESSFQNPTLSSASDILPENSSKLLPSCSQSTSNNAVSISEKPPEDINLSKEPAIVDTCISDPLNNLTSFKNLEQSFRAFCNPDKFQQDQPNSLHDSDVNSEIKSSFKPNYIFRNLLHACKNNVEEVPCEQKIFRPNSHMEVLSEDEHIFRDIRNVFEREGKLKHSTGPTETWNVHQTLDTDVFQNPSDLDNQNCYDWDKFLERWEGSLTVSDSRSRKRKRNNSSPSPSFPFNGQAKKRLCIAESPETITSLFKSSSSNEEQGSNQKFVLPSFDKEKEIQVHTISLEDSSEANTSSNFKKIIENTKIKLLGDGEIPPFVEKFMSLAPDNLPERTDVYFQNFQMDVKDVINLLKKQTGVEENVSSGTNDSNQIVELTPIVGDPSDSDVKKMIS